MPKPTEETKRREPTSINVDPDLWRRAKIEAINRGITLTELFENALKTEIENQSEGRRLSAKYARKEDK